MTKTKTIVVMTAMLFLLVACDSLTTYNIGALAKCEQGKYTVPKSMVEQRNLAGNPALKYITIINYGSTCEVTGFLKKPEKLTALGTEITIASVPLGKFSTTCTNSYVNGTNARINPNVTIEDRYDAAIKYCAIK